MAKMFRLTLSGTYQGIEWANVWHYQSNNDDTGQAAGLAAAWNTEWLNAIKGIMNVQVAITHTHVIDVPDTGDYADSVHIGVLGTFGGGSTRMPPAYTNSYTLNTSGSVIRHGFKRFIGMDETMMDSGNPSSAFNTASGVLEAKFDNPISDGTHTFTPMIVRYTGDPATITAFTPCTGGQWTKFGYQKTRES